MKCIIIEDQLPAQRILKKFITDMGSLHLVASFTDAVSALPTLQNEAIDILFLDIHLPKLSGIDFLKSLQHPPQVILIKKLIFHASIVLRDHYSHYLKNRTNYIKRMNYLIHH